MTTGVCSSCGKHGHVLRCVRCKEQWYCGELCQRKDWRKHKKECVLWFDRHTNANAAEEEQQDHDDINTVSLSAVWWRRALPRTQEQVADDNAEWSRAEDEYRRAGGSAAEWPYWRRTHLLRLQTPTKIGRVVVAYESDDEFEFVDNPSKEWSVIGKVKNTGMLSGFDYCPFHIGICATSDPNERLVTSVEELLARGDNYVWTVRPIDRPGYAQAAHDLEREDKVCPEYATDVDYSVCPLHEPLFDAAFNQWRDVLCPDRRDQLLSATSWRWSRGPTGGRHGVVPESAYLMLFWRGRKLYPYESEEGEYRSLTYTKDTMHRNIAGTGSLAPFIHHTECDNFWEERGHDPNSLSLTQRHHYSHRCMRSLAHMLNRRCRDYVLSIDDDEEGAFDTNRRNGPMVKRALNSMSSHASVGGSGNGRGGAGGDGGAGGGDGDGVRES